MGPDCERKRRGREGLRIGRAEKGKRILYPRPFSRHKMAFALPPGPIRGGRLAQIASRRQ